jgi:transcriptional regulator with XRE-family HTH domain
MSGSTDQSRNWDQSDYQHLVEARGEDDALWVQFADGTEAQVELRRLLDPPPASTPAWETLKVEPHSVSFEVDEEEVELPWLDIRAATDAAFGSLLVDRAAESAQQVGSQLRLLRERRGLSGKELAERAGLSPQSLSRIERGRHDVVYSTLQRLLTAMNYDLGDLAQVAAMPVEPTRVRMALAKAGLDDKTVERILFGTSSGEEILRRLRDVFDWSATDVDGSSPPPALATAAYGGRFKQQAREREASVAYVVWAHRVALLAEQASERPDYERPPDDPTELADAVRERYGELNFESLARFVWDSGIVIVPLVDRGQFHGACWLVGDRPVIALKQTLAYRARWAFDLGHELRHVLSHLSPERSAIVEFQDIGAAPPKDEDRDAEEREASEFATELLLGDADQLAQETAKAAGGRGEGLKRAIPPVAERNQVDLGALANYMAQRMSDEGWGQATWGVAANLQSTERDAAEIARSLLEEHLDWGRLESDDVLILRGALTEEDVIGE